MTSQLTNRFQYVKVDHNHKSNILPIYHGVPQGSILGLLIFRIYMNNMPLHLNNVCTDLYADDTTLYIIGKTVDEVQPLLSADLLRFSNWFQDNKLIINVKKSKCMIICSRKYRTKMNNPTLHLSINNNVIDCVNEP